MRDHWNASFASLKLSIRDSTKPTSRIITIHCRADIKLAAASAALASAMPSATPAKREKRPRKVAICGRKT